MLGSFWVTAIALLVATPIGVGTAVFLSEYASPRLRSTLKPIVEGIAGLPTPTGVRMPVASISMRARMKKRNR